MAAILKLTMDNFRNKRQLSLDVRRGRTARLEEKMRHKQHYYPEEGAKMKTITITTVMAFILAFGTAYAADTKYDKGGVLFDSMFGARQDVSFDSITLPSASGEGARGTAAGGLRADTDKGGTLYDSMFGARQDVPFDSILLTSAGEGAMGKAAGGLRGDTDKGSRIFDSMFGARQEVYFQ